MAMLNNTGSSPGPLDKQKQFQLDQPVPISAVEKEGWEVTEGPTSAMQIQHPETNPRLLKKTTTTKSQKSRLRESKDMDRELRDLEIEDDDKLNGKHRGRNDNIGLTGLVPTSNLQTSDSKKVFNFGDGTSSQMKSP